MQYKIKQSIKLTVFITVIILASIYIIRLPDLLWGGHSDSGKTIAASGNKAFAPAFKVKSINYPGLTLTLKKYRGKIVLVNFWATWCPPCRAEIPRLEKFYKSHRKEGFQIIGLSVNNQGPEYVAHFIKTFKGGIITYPIGMANEHIEKEYGNVYEIPQSFIINKKGYVVAHFKGELPPGFLSYEFKKIAGTNNNKK
ncbi:MAG: TlpA disulfide reductase family protein [bacterium]